MRKVRGIGRLWESSAPTDTRRLRSPPIMPLPSPCGDPRRDVIRKCTEQSALYSIQFKIFCKALFTIQSLQRSFTGNYFYNIFIYCRNLIYLTYVKSWLILYIVWGVGIITSQVFGYLGSFKGWIQTEACVILLKPITWFCVLETDWSAHDARGDCPESHFMSILPFVLSKSSVISYTHRNVKVFTATRQNKSLFSLGSRIYILLLLKFFFFFFSSNDHSTFLPCLILIVNPFVCQNK